MRKNPIVPAPVCPECSKPFITTRLTQRFCSYHCSGAANARKAVMRPLAERFWEKVDKAGDCWIWTACLTAEGYGRFGGRRRQGVGLAHRVAYELSFGPISGRLLVCHSCDVNYPLGDISYRRCVRPDHLFLGTHKDNSQDAAIKGRIASGERHSSQTHPELVPCGEDHGNAKLTEELVREIRRRIEHESQASVARSLGFSCGTINDIARGKAWKHVV